MGAGSEAALVPFLEDGRPCCYGQLGNVPECLSILWCLVSLRVYASGSSMIDMDMCLVSGLHCLRLNEVLMEGSLPHCSQKAKDRQEGETVPVPIQGHILSHLLFL